mmetsp:Transcript_23847/g.73397  ORF Transcript_23847/g.73397 Transcript_23847/m.73397 type:complete len:361 (-) Transcript_23847:1448-2530(-)
MRLEEHGAGGGPRVGPEARERRRGGVVFRGVLGDVDAREALREAGEALAGPRLVPEPSPVRRGAHFEQLAADALEASHVLLGRRRRRVVLGARRQQHECARHAKMLLCLRQLRLVQLQRLRDRPHRLLRPLHQELPAVQSEPRPDGARRLPRRTPNHHLFFFGDGRRGDVEVSSSFVIRRRRSSGGDVDAGVLLAFERVDGREGQHEHFFVDGAAERRHGRVVVAVRLLLLGDRLLRRLVALLLLPRASFVVVVGGVVVVDLAVVPLQDVGHVGASQGAGDGSQVEAAPQQGEAAFFFGGRQGRFRRLGCEVRQQKGRAAGGPRRVDRLAHLLVADSRPHRVQQPSRLPRRAPDRRRQVQ